MSNKLLLLLLAAMLASVISYAFYLEPYLVEIPSPPAYAFFDPIVEEDELNSDTINGSYHYLWTDYAQVILDPSAEDQVVTKKIAAGNIGFTFGKVTTEIIADTLFIRQHPFSISPTTTDDSTEVVVSILAAASNLKGITVSGIGQVQNVGTGNGKLELPYKKAMQNSAYSIKPIKASTLNLDIEGSGRLVLNLQVETLNISSETELSGNFYAQLELSGYCRKLTINHQNADLDVEAFKLQADSVSIYSQTPFLGSIGPIRVNAKKYLNAEINGWTNLLYLGQPTIKKQEWGSGRVIDANRYN